MSPIALSVLIVTYDAGEDIATCLALLRASRIERHYEVILVDNASRDGTPKRIASDFPWVRLIAERRTMDSPAAMPAPSRRHAATRSCC